MLKIPAPFPHAGSTAFLRPDGTEVRIIRRNADGTALVAKVATFGHPEYARDASGNLTVTFSDLAGDQRSAIGKKRGRKAA